MKRILCDQLPSASRAVPIPEGEARHAIQVFRLRNGDEVEALDGKGRSVVGRIEIRGSEARLHFVRESSPAAVSDQVLPIRLEIAALKGEAMEWTVEKAVELGVRRLVPLLTAHSVVQMGNKTPAHFQERWQRIADQALKQCGRLEAMEVAAPIPLPEHLAARFAGKRFWCDEAAKDAVFLAEALASEKAPEIALLIGPEGGWSAEERDLLGREPGIARVQLGPNVLRAETAALFSVSLAASQLRLDKAASKDRLAE